MPTAPSRRPRSHPLGGRLAGALAAIVLVAGGAAAATVTLARRPGPAVDVASGGPAPAPTAVPPPAEAVATTTPGPTAPVTTAPVTTAPETGPVTSPPAGSSPSAPPPASPPATSGPVTSPPAGPPAAESLGPGDRGPAVRQLQDRLASLGYWLGSPDGDYGDLTRQAVLAFQKAEGLARDGIAGSATRARLAGADRPRARSSSGRLLEIDLDRQLLLVVDGGTVRWALNTSTGKATTPTPPGRFAIQRQVDGVDHGPLGDLYRPKYFNAGIAVHGYPEVPASPASHGCTRVSDAAADLLWSTGAAPVGTPVWVY